MKRSTIVLLPLLGAALLSVVACHKPKPATEPATPSEQQKRAARVAEAPESARRHWTYLNRIRQADSLSSSIDRTLLNDQGEVGVILYSSVTPDKIPGLMRQVMTEMAQEFPKEDLTLNVYLPPSPPRKIGIAHLDGQTGEVTYTPAKM
jgi:hypothetical protein